MRKAAEIAPLNLLLEKSKNLYIAAYESSLNWKKEKNINFFSESVMLV